jgi:hypothetical protein
MAVAGVGIWRPVIGVSGAVRRFRRTAPPTVVMAVGTPMAVGDALTVVGSSHKADGVPMAIGEAHTKALVNSRRRLV